VAASNDRSCLVKTKGPDFYFDMWPGNYLTQCQTTNLSSDPEKLPISDITFYGIIPGGEIFKLGPVAQSYGWDVNVRAGTSVMVIGGDSRGVASGGYEGPFVVNGTDSSCIDASGPSSTASPPAGGITSGANPSSTSRTSSGSGSGGSSTSTPSSSSRPGR